VRLRAFAAGTLLTLGVVVACSNPTQPPIDASGTTVGGGGGGPPAPEAGVDAGVDSGTTVVTPEDAGGVDSATDAIDTANNCKFGTCAGCCTSPDAGGQCLPGGTTAACGTGGTACAVCTGVQTCVATIGCQ
jgi:hypothetical protein